jgi:tRNA(Ile)-lysidine synthase TilS/MesJ
MMHICREKGINAVALGHHASDAAETLLMNLLINKKLGRFCPAVAIESSAVRLIRPMIYLEEETVSRVHQRFDLPCAENRCPYEDKNQRILFKQTIDLIKKTTKIKTPALNMVQALENPDNENSYPALLKED